MKLLNREIEKRIIIKLDRSITTDGVSGIMSFGASNDYPQIIEKLILGSQTAKACTNIYSKFIGGLTFENPDIGKVIVGVDKKGKPVTLDKIRRDAARSLAMFNGVYVHCNENLDREVGTTKIVPFKNCRFSKEDANGYCGKIAVHPNWSKEPELKQFNKNDISWFYNFNIDAIEANVKDSKGIDKFKGQIYSLFFDDSYLYPLSPFDSVYLDMDTEYQIQLFKNREIRNGFSDKVVMNIDPPDDEKEKRETIEKTKAWMGPDGDKLLLFEAEFDENGELKAGSSFKLDKIPTNINDKLFDLWEKSLANNIRKAIHALPAVLIDYEQGQLSQASGEMLVQACNYYNGLTQGLRESLSEMFKDIYSHHKDPVLKNNTDWRVKPFSLTQATATQNVTSTNL
jgi:hypothetical protein